MTTHTACSGAADLLYFRQFTTTGFLKLSKSHGPVMECWTSPAQNVARAVPRTAEDNLSRRRPNGDAKAASLAQARSVRKLFITVTSLM